MSVHQTEWCPGEDSLEKHRSSDFWGCFGPGMAVASPQHLPSATLWYKAKETQGQAVLEGLVPAFSSHQAQGYTHQDVPKVQSCHICPAQGIVASGHP